MSRRQPPERGGQPTFHRELADDVPPAAEPGASPNPFEPGAAEFEAQFRWLLELAPDAIVVTSHQGTITLVNRQTERLFGYGRDELLGQPVELVVPQCLQAAREVDQQEASSRPLSVNRPLVGRHRDGSALPIAVSLGQVPGDANTPFAFIATVREVAVRADEEQDEEQEQQARAERLQVSFAVQQRSRSLASEETTSDAEASAEELRRLQALTDSALTHLNLDDLVRELLERIQTVMAVDDVGILLMDEDDGQLTVWAARGDKDLEAAAAEHAKIAMGQGFAGRIAATRASLVVDDFASFPAARPLIRQKLRSAMGVPLLIEDQVLGVVHVGSTVTRHFSTQEVQLLQRVADRIALAIAKARAFEAAQRAREEADRQADQLDRVIEAIADGVVVNDIEGTTLRINAAAQRLLALDVAPASYFALPIHDRAALYATRDAQGLPLAPEDNPSARALRGEVLTGTSAVDMRLRALDGSELALTVSAAPILGREGRIVGAVSIVRDRTEHQRLEQALRDSEARYRDLVESQTEMVCRYLPDGTLTFVNAAYCRYWGRTREDLIGKSFLDLLSPAQANRARSNLAELIEHPDVVTDEHEVVLPGGGVSWQQWVEHAILDANGQVVELQAIGRDVSERKRAEEALRESEARFRAAFESAANGMMLVNTDGRATQVNRPLAEMLGYSEEELLSRAFAELTLPDDLEPNLTLFRRAVAGELSGYELEKRFIHKDGHIVWGHLSAGVVRGAAGKPLYLVGQVQDITDRKRLEQEREAARAEAERQAEQLDRIVESMAEGVVVWDAEGRIVLTNAAQRRITGLEGAPSNFHDMPVAERTAFYAVRDWEGHALGQQDSPVARVLKGEVLTAANAPNIRMRTPDGREIEVTVSAAPLRDREGHLLGAVGIYRDQTEHNRLERERAEQAEQLDRVFEAMTDAVVVYDAQGRTLRANPAAHQLLGLDAAPPGYYELKAGERVGLFAKCDAQGRPLAPHESPSSRALRGEILTGSHAVDIRLRSLDGREVEVSSSAAPLRDPDGRIVGAVGIMRDQTERNRLRREREEARANELAVREVNQRLDTFFAMAAHDLRQPIAVSKLGVQSARLQVLDAARAARSRNGRHSVLLAQVAGVLEKADQGLNRLSRLIQQLLDVSQAREGMLRLNRQPCQLDELIRQGVQEQQQVAPERMLSLDLPANLPLVVQADAMRMGQVLTNYLSNAVRYSPEEAPIAVALRVLGAGGRARAHVEVRDRGRGIPTEDLEAIWARFQQAHNVSEAGGGLGLGLYIAKLIVERHGGEVGVESAVGQGSTFWFTLPLAATGG